MKIWLTVPAAALALLLAMPGAVAAATPDGAAARGVVVTGFHDLQGRGLPRAARDHAYLLRTRGHTAHEVFAVRASRF